MQTKEIARPVKDRPFAINCGATEDNPGLTKQSFQDECDMNKILARAEQSGHVESTNSREPRYEDISSATDYKTSLDTVHAAQASFNELPALVRRRFENDPAAFLAFVGDDKNVDEAIELGLIPKPEKPKVKAEPPELTKAEQREVDLGRKPKTQAGDE